MSKFAYTNIAGEKCLCSCTQYEGCNMECSMYRHITGKKTNADRIRAMTDEELAETFYTGCESRAYNDSCLVTQELIKRGDLAMSDEEQDEICLKCWLSWLKSPVEGGAT